MRKGNKVIRCGFCFHRIVAQMHGKRGYAVCNNCKDEIRVNNDPVYGITQQLAKIGKR